MIGKQALPSPSPLVKSPQSKLSLLSELSTAQSLASRLRIDRDRWRSAAQDQNRQLLLTDHDRKQQAHIIANLNKENADLRAGREGEVSASTKVIQDITTQLNHLANQLTEALRTVARLRRSDRAKGKVQQRNLRLKATLQRHMSATTSTPDESAKAALQEALAMAKERVEELESAGESLLEALDERSDSAGFEEEQDGEAKAVEAEVVFRSALEDESSGEMKEQWDELLGE